METFFFHFLSSSKKIEVQAHEKWFEKSEPYK